VLVAIGPGHEHGDVLAEHLLERVPEDPLRRGVGGGDPTRRVDGDDSVDCRFQNGLQPCGGPLGILGRRRGAPSILRLIFDSTRSRPP
jgi:hypothetical protein